MQSVEQHSYRETKEQNSNGCKLIVKKDGTLDSLDARERSFDNSVNGINFTIRKVNLMFIFVVLVWIFFFINTRSKILCFLSIMLVCQVLFTQLSCHRRPKLAPREKAND